MRYLLLVLLCFVAMIFEWNSAQSDSRAGLRSGAPAPAGFLKNCGSGIGNVQPEQCCDQNVDMQGAVGPVNWPIALYLDGTNPVGCSEMVKSRQPANSLNRQSCLEEAYSHYKQKGEIIDIEDGDCNLPAQYLAPYNIKIRSLCRKFIDFDQTGKKLGESYGPRCFQTADSEYNPLQGGCWHYYLKERQCSQITSLVNNNLEDVLPELKDEFIYLMLGLPVASQRTRGPATSIEGIDNN